MECIIEGVMEDISTVVQIIANLFVIFGAIFAIYQYRKQKKLTRISNAINLAKYFASKIMDRACFVYAMFRENDEIMSIIQRHEGEIKNACYFNTEEYESIFSEEERQKYKEFISSEINISGGRTISISAVLQEAINELEHCCINFNTGIAEEKAVYQSMHQVILNLFPCAYPWIGSLNQNGVDLYYTNLCELYQRWNQIREKALKREAKANRKLKKYQQNCSKIGRVKSPKI